MLFNKSQRRYDEEPKQETKMLQIACLLLFISSALGQSSCVGRCDDYADGSYTCQCNSLCDTYNDCCPDYVSSCLAQETCSGRCGESYDSSNACHCNADCIYHNNCCIDFEAVCAVGSGSCSGRCGSGIDSSKPCQCNSACQNYGDCCPDYNAVCNEPSGGGDGGCGSQSVSSSEILQVSLELFDLDVNRAPYGDVIINSQTSTSDGSTVDQAPENFYTYVNGDVLAQPTYQSLMSLLDNYIATQGYDEEVPSTEDAEQDEFLNNFMETSIGQRLYEFFSAKGLAGCGDENIFKENLKKIWFGLYSRQNGAMDTSGFEHVFVGEIKSGSVSGFHNWVQFYLQEQAGRVNYYGYVRSAEPNLYGMHFTWDGYMKGLGGSSIGSSPEYDLAVFTLCHMAKPDSSCQVGLRDDGLEVSRSIQTWTWTKTTPGDGLKYVASAYFII